MQNHAASLTSVRDLGAIFATWLALIVFMLALQFTGHASGFDVWPIGAARNWIELLSHPTTTKIVQAFWALDSRNPLSPWWYIAARPLIRSVPGAFLILHLATSLLLAVSSYLTVMSVTRGRARSFAVALGMVTSVALISSQYDHIHWNFIGALAFSLLAVFCYSEFLNNERPAWLMWSLVASIIAMQTYTIQSGAMFAVALLTYLRSPAPWWRALIRAGGVGAGYFAIWLLFMFVWKTTEQGGLTGSVAAPTLDLLFRSVSSAIWHPDYAFYSTMVRRMPWVIAALALVVGALVAFVAGRSEPTDRRDVALVLAIAPCLAVPTVAVESTSFWFPPSTRWTMMLQLWTPLLVLSLLALAPRFVWRAGVAALAGLAFLGTLSMNGLQGTITQQERRFMADLRAIVIEDKAAGKTFPRHYLVIWPGYGPSDEVNRSYTRPELGDLGEVTFRYIKPASRAVVIEPEGVKNFEFKNNATAPHASVEFLQQGKSGLVRIMPPSLRSSTSCRHPC